MLALRSENPPSYSIFVEGDNNVRGRSDSDTASLLLCHVLHLGLCAQEAGALPLSYSPSQNTGCLLVSVRRLSSDLCLPVLLRFLPVLFTGTPFLGDLKVIFPRRGSLLAEWGLAESPSEDSTLYS